jgi:hypothetical protein
MKTKFNQDVHFNDMDNNTDREESIEASEDTLESNEEWCPVCGCSKSIMDDECSMCGV